MRHIDVAYEGKTIYHSCCGGSMRESQGTSSFLEATVLVIGHLYQARRKNTKFRTIAAEGMSRFVLLGGQDISFKPFKYCFAGDAY